MTRNGLAQVWLFALLRLQVVADAHLQQHGTSATACQIVVEHIAMAEVDPRELSLTWDIYNLQPTLNVSQGGGCLDITRRDPRVRAYVKALRPFVLRISGTGCDDAQFGRDPDFLVATPMKDDGCGMVDALSMKLQPCTLGSFCRNATGLARSRRQSREGACASGGLG